MPYRRDMRRCDRDEEFGVAFSNEATRPAKVIVADHGVHTKGSRRLLDRRLVDAGALEHAQERIPMGVAVGGVDLMRKCLAMRLGRSAEPQAHARDLGLEEAPGRKPQGTEQIPTSQGIPRHEVSRRRSRSPNRTPRSGTKEASRLKRHRKEPSPTFKDQQRTGQPPHPCQRVVTECLPSIRRSPTRGA